MAASRSLENLVEIMARLRGPDGCPWDREQSYETLRGFLLEECYEAVEAIDEVDPAALREELGDLLFQIVFLSRIAEEDGAFSMGDVVEGIAVKMVRRHPHVFGGDTARDADDVLRKWEAIKRREKSAAAKEAPASSVLDGLPRALPALVRAQRLGDKAARVGFDWRGADEVFEKVDEEVGELRSAVASGEAERIREELGDVLFALAMLARHLDVDPEAALEQSSAKFRRRFLSVETALRRSGVAIEDAGLDRLEELWRAAKLDASP